MFGHAHGFAEDRGAVLSRKHACDSGSFAEYAPNLLGGANRELVAIPLARPTRARFVRHEPDLTAQAYLVRLDTPTFQVRKPCGDPHR